MRFTLDITMNNKEGALERLLGRLRQRNFSICNLTAGCSDDFSTMSALITVESGRAPELAVKQLDKLIDVERVRVFEVEEKCVANEEHRNVYSQ